MITLTAGDFADALSQVVPFAGSEQSLDKSFWNAVEITTLRDAVRLSCYYAEVGIRHRAPALVGDQMATMVPAKTLFGITRQFPRAGAVTIRVVKEQGRGIMGSEHEVEKLSVECGKARFKLAMIDVGIEWPEIDYHRAWRIGAESLVDLFDKTGYATGSSTIMPVLHQNLLLEIPEAEKRWHAVMTATDGRKLAQAVAPAVAAETFSEVVPVSVLRKARRHWLHWPTEIEVAATGNYLGFRTPHSEVVATRVSDSFPDYRPLLKEDGREQLTIHKAALAGALRRLAVIATSSPHSICLSVKADRVKATCASDHWGDANIEIARHAFEFSGTEIKVLCQRQAPARGCLAPAWPKTVAQLLRPGQAYRDPAHRQG